MVQNASTNPALTHSAQNLAAQSGHGSVSDRGESGNFSVNSYADRLMDDLFQDVEDLVDPGQSRSKLARRPADGAPQTVDQDAATRGHSPVADSDADRSGVHSGAHSGIEADSGRPSLSFTPSPIPPANTPDLTNVSDLVANYGLATHDAFVDNFVDLSSASPLSNQVRKNPGSFDRLLLGVGCISVVISMALWLLYQEAHRQRPAISTAPPTAAATVEQTNQFADYVQKTLERIGQQSPQTPGTATAPGGVQQNAMPAVAIPPQPTTAPVFAPRVSTGLERIYVPTYQFPPSAASPSVLVTPLPAAPKLSKPTTSPSVIGTKSAAVAAASNAAPSGVVRRLSGVLNQGDRSVALFEVNGISQRFEIGESLGSSGWTLVEVTQNQAMIRRNGEVRSVYVGQTF
jgi:hypothetical protein